MPEELTMVQKWVNAYQDSERELRAVKAELTRVRGVIRRTIRNIPGLAEAAPELAREGEKE